MTFMAYIAHSSSFEYGAHDYNGYMIVTVKNY